MSSSLPTRIGAALGAMLLTPTLGHAGDDGVRRLLLDRQLNATEVRVTAIDGGEVRWVDSAGRPRARSIRELLAVIDPEGGLLPDGVRRQVIESLGAPLVETTDGQRLLARLGETDTDEQIELTLVGGQRVRVSVEDIASVTSPRAVFGATHAPARERPIDDVVELANGDVVTGFVASLGARVAIEVDGRVQEIPLADVARVRLANPERTAEGTRVWLDDGSILGAGPIASAGDAMITFDLTLGRPLSTGSEGDPETAVRVPLSRVAGVVFDAGSSGVRPLASMRPEAYAPTGDRRWTPAPITGDSAQAVLGAATIELPGPMRVRWALPEGARRLAGVATLGETPGPWADCSVSVLLNAGGETIELARARLHPSQGDLAFNVELPDTLGGEDRSLEVRVDAGAYGPIQDRVLLERVLLLVRN
ncbi:MAG: hypothetical protein ACIARR_11640 [Phycisphaerales bacterium JB059]